MNADITHIAADQHIITRHVAALAYSTHFTVATLAHLSRIYARKSMMTIQFEIQMRDSA
jgi:hypothetical protein